MVWEVNPTNSEIQNLMRRFCQKVGNFVDFEICQKVRNFIVLEEFDVRCRREIFEISDLYYS